MSTINRFGASRFYVTMKQLVICVFLIRPVTSCMAGYEAERAKLRQYLGIEWVPKGMDKADEKQTRYIRHSEDLNCDFRHPEDCKWQNVKGLDTLDFHLFKKEDSTLFPVVQVRPGPSKVAVGDYLLFTGDRKKTEKDAILASWPIKCQNSSGVLTFTFWTYNGAHVEVLLMEDVKVDNKTEIRISPESLHVDCGTVTIDTECKVEIPPRDSPFRLAIRAYDISHPEGSFVMVDNVIYEAQLCKVAIDMGDGFKTEPLQTRAEGQAINTASDLACYNFDQTCRWRNGGHEGTLAWRQGTTKPNELVLFNETGTYTAPKAPFAFLYVEQDHTTGTRRLVSDPVECQASAGSTLTFRVWANKGIKVEACVMDLDMNELECQPVSTERAPAPYTHHFAYTKKFMVGPKKDHFVVIDDIDYEATMCTEAFGSLDFGKGFYTTPMLGVVLNRAAHSAQDISCDFSRRGLDCFWANMDEDPSQTKWEIGLGSIDQVKFEYLTGKSLAPKSDFAVARFARGSSEKTAAILISETIRCMSESGSLGLNFWRTGDASLAVCVVRSFNDQILDCQDVGEGTAERIEVDIPNYREPVRLALRAEVPEDLENAEGLVAVDDIEFKGHVCSNVAWSANSHAHNRNVPLQADPFRHQTPLESSVSNGVNLLNTPDANVCRLLSCRFDGGHMCLYESHRVASSVTMFAAFNNTGHAMLFERGRVAILESTPFHLNAPARLHFDYAMTELDSCYAVNGTGRVPLDGTYAHDFIEILPSDTKVYLIVKLASGSAKSSVFIDNLELTDTDNRQVC